MTTVSIVTPCLNGERYLAQCIRSVLDQTMGEWEWLMVDDGSTDGSLDVMRQLSEMDDRIKLLSTPGREGAAVARNLGIAAASGKYIAFLDCDDAWMPHKLEMQVRRMKDCELAFCWSSYDVIDDTGRYVRTQTSPHNCTYRDLLTKRAVIGCLTAVYDQEMYGRQLMPLIRMGQDYGLFLRLLRISKERGLRVGGLTASLAKYRIHSSAMTKNKLLKAWYQWRLYRDIEMLSLLDSTYCFGSYIIRGVKDRF